MLKILTGLLVFAFVSSAAAMEISIIRNTDSLGEDDNGKPEPYILVFDGESAVKAPLVRKIISCHGSFSKIDKAKLLDLLDLKKGISEMEANHRALNADPEFAGYLTLKVKDRHEEFVDGPLKECLSK